MDWIPHNKWVNRPEYEAAVLRVMRSGHVAQGAEVEAFEHELAERFRPGGAALCVSSGTAALYLALKLVSERCGGRISIPTYACSALYNAVRLAGYDGALDLLDCDSSNFGVSNATIGVHTYGVPCGPAVIEDATHAPGATLDGKPCGSIGHLSVMSFGATKPLGIGAGGAVFGSKDSIEAIREVRDYDTNRKLSGFNFQLSDIHAAIGRARLKRLDKENEDRARIVQKYGLARPRGLKIQLLSGDRSNRVWYRYVVRPPNVKGAKRHFEKAQIETIVPLMISEQIHRRLGLNPECFPNSEDIAHNTLSLPVWPGMSDRDVSRVAECLSTLRDCA